jgi:succinoglycan biosynthesis transport protein ExoP
MSGFLPSPGALQPNQMIEASLPRIIAAPDANAAAPFGELGDLKEILAIIRRRKWLVLFMAACASAVAGYFAYTKTPIYLAAASVRIADERRAISGGIADAPSANIGSSYWVDPVLSQIQVLKSREVAAEAVKRQPFGTSILTDGFPTTLIQNVRVDSVERTLSLPTDFDSQGFVLHDGDARIRGAYGKLVSIDGLSFTIARRPPHRSAKIVIRTALDAIAVLLDGVDARPRKSTDVVDVTYRANDPVVAQQVVNTIIASYKAVNASTSQQQSVRRREFIESQLKQTDSLFADATMALSNFASHEQVYGSDARVAAEQTGLMTLDVNREELTADKRTLESLLENLHNAGTATHTEKLDALLASPGVANNPVVTALFQQLIDLRSARDSLGVGKWGAAKTNPDVLKLDSLIATTQGELLSAVRSNIDAVNARLGSLNELRGRNATQLQKLPSVQAVEARLVQRVETAKKMADQLREEFQRARISEAVEVGQVEIVDYATAPNLPIGRSSLFRVLTGLLVGLIIGGGAAVIVERLNTTVRKRDDIESVLRIPGLAVIPQISTNGTLGAWGRSLHLPRAKERRDKARGESLVTLSDFGSVTAEAFRTLRTNLIFSQSIQTLRTMVITSPSPQDGKTTTAANLAITFAQQGMRVLLIDCDLRKARLHTLFKVAREPGFSQFLARQNTLAEVTRTTAVENLFLIPAGLLPANPSELVGSAIARTTIASLAEDYDIVLIDTPPVHVAADALILGSMANGVLMVLRAGHSERGAAQEALQRLNNVGAHILGAVLNDPDHKIPEYGNYYYYYDYHDDKVRA